MDALNLFFGVPNPRQDAAVILTFAGWLLAYPVVRAALRRRPRGGGACRGALKAAYVLFLFAALEGVTRWTGTALNHPLLRPHPTRVWQLRPHLATRHDGKRLVTNSLGYRNAAEFAEPRPPGTLRVLCLGDSWMYGFGVHQEETIPAVLEELLEKEISPVEVINAGVFGYGAAQGVATLKEALPLEPQVVVVGLFHNINSQRVLLEAGKGPALLLRRSRFYLWLRLKLEPLLRRWQGPSRADRLLLRSLRRDYGEMARLAREAGALCVFLEYRGPPPGWPGRGPASREAARPGPSVQIFREVAREEGCILVRANYFQAPGGERYCDLERDRFHPNAAGCRWIAERTAAAILGRLGR